jgi:Type II secretion system (T2SS), protein G
MEPRPNRLSYVEILVCGAIVVASAGVVVPALKMRDIGDAQTRVTNDLHRIAQSIGRYVDDTRTFPTGAGGATTLHYLYSDGVRPTNNALASGPGLHIAEFMNSAGLGGESWKGPYLDERIGPDPWGHAYIVNVNGFFSSAERVMVLSAGPNGQINTPPSATIPGGDDLMLLVE